MYYSLIVKTHVHQYQALKVSSWTQPEARDVADGMASTDTSEEE
jgi:hypothetical protein